MRRFTPHLGSGWNVIVMEGVLGLGREFPLALPWAPSPQVLGWGGFLALRSEVPVVVTVVGRQGMACHILSARA